MQGLGPTFRDLVDPAAVAGVVAGLVGDLVAVLWSITLALIIAAFLLLRFTPGPDAPTNEVSEGMNRAAREVNRYVFVKTGTSLVTGLAVGLLTWALDADLPLLYGLLAFLLNYIPNLGSIIAVLPPLALALLQQGPGTTSLMAIGYLVINMVVGNFIEPRIMGRALGLSPLVVLLSVIFWGWLLGVVGALFSALLTLIVRLLLLATEDLHGLGVALGPRRQVPTIAVSAQDLLEEALPQTVPPPP